MNFFSKCVCIAYIYDIEIICESETSSHELFQQTKYTYFMYSNWDCKIF